MEQAQISIEPSRMQWPPDYARAIFNRRLRLEKLKSNRDLRHAANLYYQTHPVEWIQDWCITYNPRNKAPLPKYPPFLLFDRQKDFVEFVVECIRDGESGLVEKCRDVGLTWLCVALSVWLWLYWPGTAIGWGSRKEKLVDEIGIPDSIFEKIRMLIERLPSFMMPANFNPRLHSTFMKILNPDNGSTISGEAGDNIGRGGRKTIYFKDESAHYERPEKIEAALGDNTDVQIDISSVNGTANVFYRRRSAGRDWVKGETIEAGYTRVFTFDWRHHPGKTPEWYSQRRAKFEREGLLHIFAQEVDRDYSSAVEGIIIPQQWVKAAIDAHLNPDLGIVLEGERMASLDVADGGGDSNALSARIGVVVNYVEEWAKADDVGESTRKAINHCQMNGIKEMYYDSIGIGAGVKSEVNRLKADNELPAYLRVLPWNASESPLNADDHLIPGDIESPLNSDIFRNMKSQGWFLLKQRFEKTFKAVTYGIKYPPEELISLCSQMPLLHKLCNQLSQPVWKEQTTTGKMLVDKTPDGSFSPNLGDSVMMLMHPTREVSIFDVL